MAEKLKRDYDIVVLKVQVSNVPRGEPDIHFTLQCKVDGRLANVLDWRGSTAELGLGPRVDRSTIENASTSATLPDRLLKDLGVWMDTQTTHERPLWVHLVRPYGVLRFIPWERLLNTALNRPILMLPDFLFPPPREVASVLDVVLCGSAPLGYEEGSVAVALEAAATGILAASPRRTRLHVFVDAALAGPLRASWDAEGRLNGQITLYDHHTAAQYVEPAISSRVVDQVGTLRSPWLLWMREALKGRSVDVVHFICHGYLSRDRGAMLFAQSPLERTDRYLAGPVGATELQTFLTQVGAWSTVFTAVEYNNSEAGIRSLADEIAQSRPGPMMMHTMAHDPTGAALSAGYRFLYGQERQPPPASTAMLIYCQPYLDINATLGLKGKSAETGRRRVVLSELSRNPVQRAEIARSAGSSPLDRLFSADENVATWVGSTERFVEQVQLQYQQLARDEMLPAAVHQQDSAIVNDILQRIRSAVAVAAGGQVTPADASPPQGQSTEDPDASGTVGELA